MADSTRYTDWLNKAKIELESAEILMENGGNNAVIAFLCQQSMEKSYKGYILRQKKELVDGHSLVYLCRIAAETDESFKQLMKDSAYMNQFYLETRYPADIPINISDPEARNCIKIAKAVLCKTTAL